MRTLGMANEATILGIARRLGLTRPLVIFDLETTGPMAELDQIFELAGLKIVPVDGEFDIDTINIRCRPGIPMTAGARDITGVADQDLAHLPPLAHYGARLLDFFTGADLCGFNVRRFDVKILAAELRRHGIADSFPAPDVHVVDSYLIFAHHRPRTLSDAAVHYCGAEPAARLTANAHAAAHDVITTLEVLAGQLTQAGMPTTVAGLAGIGRRQEWLDQEGRWVWRNGEVILNFTKHKGATLQHLATHDRRFLEWILERDFPADTKAIVSDALAGRFPVPPGAEERDGS